MGWFWTQRQDIGPSPRLLHAMAYDPVRKQTVLFGGRDLAGNAFADTWAWDGKNWTQVADTGPSARSGHGLAFDSARGAIVLFGGSSSQNATDLADTWMWDGSAWTQVSDTGPSGRSLAPLAYHPAAQLVLLFGGRQAANPTLGDTWTWDGSAWTQVADTGPSARAHHGLAATPDGTAIIAFGGLAAGELDDTWSWNGTLWTQIADTGPSARDTNAVTTPAGVLVYGGQVANGSAADTWTLSGAQWVQRQDIGPGARQAHALAWDSDRGTVVLHGGVTEAVGHFDTWELPVAGSSTPSGGSVTATAVLFTQNPVSATATTDMMVMLSGAAPAAGADITVSTQAWDPNGAPYNPAADSYVTGLQASAGMSQIVVHAQASWFTQALNKPSGSFAVLARTPGQVDPAVGELDVTP